jgi:uncharacterized protein YbjT (DUF2867 family)
VRVFVTGATGFVGSAVVRALLAAGHDVTGLVRDPGRAAGLAALGADLRRGDVLDPGSYRTAPWRRSAERGRSRDAVGAVVAATP